MTTKVTIAKSVAPVLVSNTEYARMIGVSPRTLWTYEAKGILSPAKRINGRKYRDPNERPQFDVDPA